MDKVWRDGKIDMFSFDHDTEEDEGYLAAGSGQSLSENPHPRGTIRYQQWRSSWQLKQAEIQRSIRLATRHVAV